MKKINCLFVLFYMMNIVAIYSQDQMVGGIIYGNDWAFMVSAPDGWIMDSKSLSQYNIFALFYENGKVLGGSTPIIYINTTVLANNTDDEMKIFISWDLENHNKNNSKIIMLNNKLEGITDTYFIYNIENTRGQLETIIYRRYKNTCFSIILNAPNESIRKQLFSKMVDIINSMKFMDKN